MKTYIYLIAALLLLQLPLRAQMWNGQDSLYGNEWIHFEQSYYKIMAVEDGIYRLSFQTLFDAGVPVNDIPGSQFQVFYMGGEIPIHTSTNATFGPGDYLEFYGKKNRSELDRFLFKNPDEEMMNPEYSLFTDTSAYFLTWTTAANTRRYETIQNDLDNLPAKEDYYLHRQVENFTETFDKKRTAQSVKKSFFELGEGWSSPYAVSQMFTLEASAAFPAGEASEISLRYSTSVGQHNQIVRINGTQVAQDEFFNYQIIQHAFELSNDDLNNPIEIQFEGTASATDRQRVATIILKYPRAFDFDNETSFSFEIAASGNRKYMEIENFDAGNSAVLYDRTNEKRLVVEVASGIVKIALPPSTVDRELTLLNDNSGAKIIEALEPVSFINYRERDAEYIIISNKKLFSDASGTNWVQEYANYRSSSEEGSYSTIIVEIQQLYDQFAYGVQRHPISIRNFGHFVEKFWENPEFVFIIGKGREYIGIRKEEDLNNPQDLPVLVPTFGFPGSDNLLLGSNTSAPPVIPIGRLAATVPKEVDIYLRKVKGFESNTDLPQTIEARAWMKHVIHLGGGSGPGEQALIKSNLSAMEDVIENNQFGGEVSSFFKSSSDPVQISTSDLIFDRINKGVSIITFFGHSGANAFDFSIDNPDNYDNKDKYPLMFSLGCFIGNIHTSFKGISERFVFNEDKGAVGFAASTSLGFISALRTYMQKVYGSLGGDLYGESLGKVLQNASAAFDNGGFGTFDLAQQMTLHGDPALRLNPLPGPDFVVDRSSVSFDPPVINTQLKDFELKFSIVNIGKGVGDSITVKIEQEFPDRTSIVPIIQKIKAPTNTTTLTVTIPTYGRTSVGQNTLFISLDTENEVEELPAPQAESNNELQDFSGQRGIQFFIQDNGVETVYPQEFAIVNKPNITLIASTLNALASERKYILELDTTELFNSPMKQRTEIVQKGGLVKWTPTVAWQQEQVYYWRVSPDSLSVNQGFVWSNSSFVYLPGSEGGWNQSDFWQFRKDVFDDKIKLIDSTRSFSFVSNLRDVRVKNKVWEPGSPPEFVVSGNPIGCPWPWLINEGVQMIIPDPVFYPNWLNPPIGEGAYGSVPSNGFLCPWVFRTTSFEDRANLIDFLENGIPLGRFVIFYTIQKSFDANYKPEEWGADSIQLGKNLFSVLESMGAKKVRQLEEKGAVPYVFIFQKGGQPLVEDIAQDINDLAIVEYPFPEVQTEGNFGSTLVGPAKKWKEFQWNLVLANNPENDTINFSIRGINLQSGTDTLLFENLLEPSFSLNGIDASQFPYLKIVFNSKDEIDRTTANLDYWRITFEGVPELAVNPNQEFFMHQDTLPQGDDYLIRYAIENISQQNSDSVLIKYLITDSNNSVQAFFNRIPALQNGESTTAEFGLNTRSLENLQRISVEVNPDNDQAELSHKNNFIISDFFVEKDNRNPVLDVTFDGQHILNGDLISPRPRIVISLQDENRFLELADTSLFKILIKFPGNPIVEEIPFEDETVRFIPAIPGNIEKENKATVELSPAFEEDGTYELIVQSEDVAGNQSGEFDFKVSFKVINKKMISNVLNYPNPFSTSTRFVYTLTGDEPPAFFKIQIMTISGRIVKEITQDELGLLKIGTHTTDYAWDGRDAYGDSLANGIYLYRVLAKQSDGKDYEQLETGSDTFFKNGFGKMVILR